MEKGEGGEGGKCRNCMVKTREMGGGRVSGCGWFGGRRGKRKEEGKEEGSR